MFITFEAVNGAGKTTQAKRLLESLTTVSRDAIFTREPGGSEDAEVIRNILISGDADRWSRKEELLLFTAARANHVRKTIGPALAAGKIVVCDRFVDSTRVLQTLDDTSREFREIIDDLHATMVGRESDVTLLLEVSPDTIRARLKERLKQDPDRFELIAGMAEHEQAAYTTLASEFPDRIVRVNGEGTEDEVAKRVWAVVEQRLEP